MQFLTDYARFYWITTLFVDHLNRRNFAHGPSVAHHMAGVDADSDSPSVPVGMLLE